MAKIISTVLQCGPDATVVARVRANRLLSMVALTLFLEGTQSDLSLFLFHFLSLSLAINCW